MLSSRKHRIQRYRREFTIIELLIVISIIIILASLLLPALNAAKNRARTLICVSVLKQYGMAMNNYINDYQGWIPPVSTSLWIDGETLGMRGFLAPYLGIRGNKPQLQMVRKKLYCIQREEIDRPSGGVSQPNYAANNWLIRQMDKIGTPSRVCHLTEFSNEPGASWVSSSLSGHIPALPSHRDSANVLFCDGHVSTIHYKKIPCPEGNGVGTGTDYGKNQSYLFWSSSLRTDPRLIYGSY